MRKRNQVVGQSIRWETTRLQLDALRFNLSCCDSKMRILDSSSGFRDSSANGVSIGRRVQRFWSSARDRKTWWGSCGYERTCAEVWRFNRVSISLQKDWLPTPWSAARLPDFQDINLLSHGTQIINRGLESGFFRATGTESLAPFHTDPNASLSHSLCKRRF